MDKQEMARLLEKFSPRLVEDYYRVPEETVYCRPDDQSDKKLKALEIPQEGRPMEAVYREILDEILPWRMRMNHPRMYSFIPSPTSDAAVLADVALALTPTFAGSWLQGYGVAHVEQMLLDYFCNKVGYGENSGGVFVSGGSMANFSAKIIARDEKLNRENRSLAVAYASEQTHSSVAKGLHMAGFYPENLVKIPVKEDFTMDVDALEKQIAKDKAAGKLPFLVVGSCGTTNTGSVDDLEALGAIAEAEALWFHVDGAYGASILLSPTHKNKAKGIALADSISWDAHKWLFQSYVSSMLLVKDREKLYHSFNTDAEYLRDAMTLPDQVNFWEISPEMTRPTRALKLWATLQYLGEKGMAEAIDRGIALAEYMEELVHKEPEFELLAPVGLAVINYRYAPEGYDEEALNDANAYLSRRILEDGYAGIVTTVLQGKVVLRMCTIHPEGTREDMEGVLQHFKAYGEEWKRK